MEEQIRGFALGGGVDDFDIFSEPAVDPFAIPSIPVGAQPLPTAPTLTPPTLDLSGFSLAEEDEDDPFALPDLDGLLEQAAKSEAKPAPQEESEEQKDSRTFTDRYDEYKRRLGPLMAQSERPTLYDLAADIGAAMLAAPADTGPFASSAAGFIAFNKRLRKQRDDKRKVDQAIALKAFEMAREDEKAAEDYLNQVSLERIKLANKAPKMQNYQYDETDPATGETRQRIVSVDENNQLELAAIRSLPNARRVSSAGTEVNITQPDPSKFMERRGQSLNDSIVGIEEARNAGVEQQRLINMMQVALSRLGENVGVVEAKTLPFRKLLNDMGIRYDGKLGDQELLNTLGTRIAMQLIGDTKGAITEMEMRLFIAASPGLASSKGGLLKQSEYLKRIADLNVKLANDFYSNEDLQNKLGDPELNDVQRAAAYNQWYANWQRSNPFLDPTELSELRQFAANEPEVAASYRRQFRDMDSEDMTERGY